MNTDDIGNHIKFELIGCFSPSPFLPTCTERSRPFILTRPDFNLLFL